MLVALHEGKRTVTGLGVGGTIVLVSFARSMSLALTNNRVDCLRLTKCVQRTSETLQGVADLYDKHVSSASTRTSLVY